ncbi:hypothetical protein [Diplocloster agilis]|uniref:hypothetical protein n=1 Tax=Diplocloster agilis TaxID=2850323 RepID=UPI002265877A|nr:hypothetical protein [Suonthocola fibrivorans]MCU6734994.1 hypothetical protein [Suonthocola fibrivorans]
MLKSEDLPFLVSFRPFGAGTNCVPATEDGWARTKSEKPDCHDSDACLGNMYEES